MKSEIGQGFKIKYFCCKKGNLHEGQVLNYVCIDQKCSQKGLICSICKNQHLNHIITPLKFLLVSLKSHSQKPIQTQSFQDHLQKLQQIKNSYLYELKVAVQNIANQIRKIEEYILKNYRQNKQFLLRQVELNMKYNQIINTAIKDQYTNQNQFQKDFKMIANFVVPIKSQSSNSFAFALNLQKTVQIYENQLNSFRTNLNQYALQANELIKIFSNNQIKKPIQIKSSQKNQNNNQYVFSEKNKGPTMKIQNNGKLIKCQKSSSQRFALIDQKNGKPIHKIKLKIQRLISWIGVGVAIRKKIIDVKFNFNYNQLGHGSYLLSNNCYSWSSSNLNNNIKGTLFSFKQNDIISLQMNNKKLKFLNQTSKIQFILDVQVTKQQQSELCFCVNLSQAQDSVSIIQ